MKCSEKNIDRDSVFSQKKCLCLLTRQGQIVVMHYESLDISLRGKQVTSQKLLVRGQRVSAVAVMSTEGILDCHIVSGSVNADSFEEFVERSLLPHLMPFNGVNPHSVVVLDNCSIHHVDHILNFIEGLGVLVLFLPPYSPELNQHFPRLNPF